MSGKRILLIAVGVIVLAGCVASGIGWIMWTHSPAYSLREIVTAVRERDRYKFERYVDTETLIQSMMADYVEQSPMAMTLANTMTSSLKQQVTKVIEDGTLNTEYRFGYGLSTFIQGGPDLELNRQGTNAYFVVRIKTNGGAPFKLRFHMTQVPDGYWRVDRATNVRELSLAEAAEEAARKAILEKELEGQLTKLYVVAKLHTSISGDYGWERKNRFQIRFKNNADKTINGMTAKITCASSGFDEGVRGDLHIAPGEAANGVWEFRVNQFIPETERMYALGETDHFDVVIDSISFDDGSKIKRGKLE